MESPREWIEPKKVIEAARLYRHMLDLGFSPHHSILAVESKKQLNSIEKQLLIRCVDSREESEKILKKIVSLEEIQGKTLAMDFYNVITTIAEALEGHLVFRCTDGLVRDIASALGRSKKSEEIIIEAIEEIKKVIAYAKPSKLYLVMDKQISFSAERIRSAREVLSQAVDTEGILSESADSELIRLSRMEIIASSSDGLIARNVSKIFDIPQQVLVRRKIFGKNAI
ncbi:MAG: DUF5616 domain-containing protein, partial [Fervidicoccaceae archaeon]